MCALVLVFCLSSQSRQELPGSTLLTPVPWPSTHRCVRFSPSFPSRDSLILQKNLQAEPECSDHDHTCRVWRIMSQANSEGKTTTMYYISLIRGVHA